MQETAQCADRHNSAVLYPEASLAHLHHQPGVAAGEAAGTPLRAGQLQGAVHDAGATADGFARAGPGSALWAAEQASETGIDMAALQKEVTELRQQVQAANML